MTLREIADFAAVRPSAVSNWKRRHADFPSPAQATSSGTVYRTDEVIDWLKKHDRLHIAPEDMGTVNTFENSAALAVRMMLREANPDVVQRIVLSLFLHASVSHGPLLRWPGGDPEARIIPLSIPPDASTDALIEQFDEADQAEAATEFVVALKRAWGRLEDLNADLEGLLLRADVDAVQPGLVWMLLLAFHHLASEGQATDVDPVHRVLWDEIAPFEIGPGDVATPTGVGRLLVQLASGTGHHMVDLAAGRGHLIFDAAVERWRAGMEAELDAPRSGSNAGVTVDLVDPDADALNEARIWSLVYDIPIGIHVAGIGEPLPIAQPIDMIVADAPMHVRTSESLSGSDEAWQWLSEHAGGNLEMGFLVLATQLLAPSGRAAIVVSTQAATSRSTRIREVRGELVNSGHIEAVIALPGNLHRGISRPVSVVLLRGERSSDPILLLDASSVGTARRRARQLTDDETDAIAGLVHDWRRDGTVRSLANVRSVAVDPVDLEEHVLDAALYLAPPDIPDALQANTRVEDLEHELQQVAEQLAGALDDLLRRSS